MSEAALAARGGGHRENRSVSAPARGGLAGWQVRRVEELAKSGLGSLTVTRMASEARLSLFWFVRAFGVSMGEPPGRWLTRMRVERARILLETGDTPIGEIARTVGYKGAPQLTRAFRRRMGMSPLQYRRR